VIGGKLGTEDECTPSILAGKKVMIGAKSAHGIDSTDI
jgi:hypothetical protein